MPGPTYSVQYVEGDGEIIQFGQFSEAAHAFYDRWCPSLAAPGVSPRP